MPSPDDIESDSINVPDHVIDGLARFLLPKLRAYFESPEGQAAFEAWKQTQN